MQSNCPPPPDPPPIVEGSVISQCGEVETLVLCGDDGNWRPHPTTLTCSDIITFSDAASSDTERMRIFTTIKGVIKLALSLCRSVCQSIRLSILSVCLSVCRPALCLSAYLHVCEAVCISVCLSFYSCLPAACVVRSVLG